MGFIILGGRGEVTLDRYGMEISRWQVDVIEEISLNGKKVAVGMIGGDKTFIHLKEMRVVPQMEIIETRELAKKRLRGFPAGKSDGELSLQMTGGGGQLDPLFVEGLVEFERIFEDKDGFLERHSLSAVWFSCVGIGDTQTLPKPAHENQAAPKP